MILVLLGTQKYKFDRLIEAVLRLVEDVGISEEVVIQTGVNDYPSIINSNLPNVKQYEYLEDYDALLSSCDAVICHGGVGIIMECLLKKKKVLTMPRIKKYNEHVNDHQKEITSKLSEDNYLVMFRNFEELKVAYLEIDNLELKLYEENNFKFNRCLNDSLNKLF